MIVFDDYAENIQQNQVKTTILASFSRFFSNESPFCPDFPGKTRSRPASAGGRLQTASLRPRGSNAIKNRPVAEIIATLKPAPAYASALRIACAKSLNERCM